MVQRDPQLPGRDPRAPSPHPFHAGLGLTSQNAQHFLGREVGEGCGIADRKLVWRMRKAKCLPLGKVCSPSPGQKRKWHLAPALPRVSAASHRYDIKPHVCASHRPRNEHYLE